MKTQAMNHW